MRLSVPVCGCHELLYFCTYMVRCCHRTNVNLLIKKMLNISSALLLTYCAKHQFSMVGILQPKDYCLFSHSSFYLFIDR